MLDGSLAPRALSHDTRSSTLVLMQQTTANEEDVDAPRDSSHTIPQINVEGSTRAGRDREMPTVISAGEGTAWRRQVGVTQTVGDAVGYVP